MIFKSIVKKRGFKSGCQKPIELPISTVRDD